MINKTNYYAITFNKKDVTTPTILQMAFNKFLPSQYFDSLIDEDIPPLRQLPKHLNIREFYAYCGPAIEEFHNLIMGPYIQHNHGMKIISVLAFFVKELKERELDHA